MMEVQAHTGLMEVELIQEGLMDVNATEVTS